jgi:hypothetical protein
VELLLTFEEYCSEEGVFEIQGENGKAFADIFEPVSGSFHFSDVSQQHICLLRSTTNFSAFNCSKCL